MRYSARIHVPPSIATSGAYHCEDFRPLAGRLSRVPPGKEELEQVAEELQRDILERKCGAMEELEDKLVVAELGQGCDVGMPERGRVRSGHDRAQIVTRELVRGDVKREDGDGEIDEGVGFPLFSPVGG